MSFEVDHERERGQLQQLLRETLAGRQIMDVTYTHQHEVEADQENVILSRTTTGFWRHAIVLTLDDGTEILLDEFSFAVRGPGEHPS